jgi:hypothetical protein
MICDVGRSNGTRLSIKPEMNATSRERRQSFATTTGTFAFRAFASDQRPLFLGQSRI